MLERLHKEWQESGDAARFPDVEALFKLLGEAPETVIRQLPSAARDALTLCDDASLSRLQLGDRLSSDPSLVGAILRQANGAFYGSGLATVLRVDAAIDRIGITGTRAIVLASCIDGLLSKPGGELDEMVGAVWSHMVETAPIARRLAPEFGADSEEAFAVALLHDVGKMVIFDRISALRSSLRRNVQLPHEWLSLVLTHLHEPIGALAAHTWRLGPAAADAIGLHHRREIPHMHHPLAEVLHLAERADHARRMRSPLDLDGIWKLADLNANQFECELLLRRFLRAV